MAHAYGPMPLEAINKILDKQFPKKTDEIYEDITDFPSIESDINTLSSKERRARSDAYKRLIARGDVATPDIILKISDSDTSLLKKMRLINLLGRIKTPGTDKDIIAFTEMLRGLDKDVRKLKLKTVYFQAFRSLSKYKGTSAAIDYANTLLEDKEINPVIHAQAVFFLADQNVKEAEKWGNAYSNKNISIDEQYALRYLDVKIGTESGIQKTINFLLNLPKSKNNYKYETHKLLNSLAHIVNANKMQGIISSIKSNNSRFTTDKKINSYPLLSALYNGEDKDRQKAALALLNGWSNDKKATLESLKYMISINDATPYINLWKLHHPVLIKLASNFGYIINFDGDLAKFIETPEHYNYQTPKPNNLVESLIKSFKNKDITSFKSSLFPDIHTFESINQDAQNKSEKQNIDELYYKFKNSAIDSWSNIIKKASLAELNWTDISYKSENEIFVGINGSHISKIIIYIEEDNKKHTIVLEGCILFNSKWYVLSGMKWS